MLTQINKDILIGDLIEIDPGVIAILMGAGMHCVGCPSSAMESLEEAAMVHGMDAEPLVNMINKYLATVK